MLYAARVTVQSTGEPCPFGHPGCSGVCLRIEALPTTHQQTKSFAAEYARRAVRAPVGPYGLAGVPLLFPGGGVVR